VTNGSRTIYQNNQPVVVGNSVGVHNGIVTNDRALSGRCQSSSEPDASDSELLFRMIDTVASEHSNVHAALRDAYRKIEGEASIAFIRNDLNAIVAATNTGSIFWVIDQDHTCLIFASERVIVKRCLADGGILARFNSSDICQLAPGKVLFAPFSAAPPEILPIEYDAGCECSAALLQARPHRSIHDPASLAPVFQRCTRCILPHTYPFIEFDAKGVCNYCAAFKKQKFMGREALELVLAAHRSTDGSPDCIVGLAAGGIAPTGFICSRPSSG